MCRPNAGEALGLGFDHRTKVIAAGGALLLQVEPDRVQVFVVDRLGEQGAIVVCTDRLLDGVRGQQRILAEPAQARAARPRKCDGVVRHASADGVQVDAAAAAQKIVFAIDKAGLVPTFPQRSGARVARVELPDLAAAELLHQATCGTHFGRRCQQVDVVVHQYIGVQLAARGEQRLPQQLATAGAIGVVEEAG